MLPYGSAGGNTIIADEVWCVSVECDSNKVFSFSCSDMLLKLDLNPVSNIPCELYPFFFSPFFPPTQVVCSRVFIPKRLSNIYTICVYDWLVTTLAELTICLQTENLQICPYLGEYFKFVCVCVCDFNLKKYKNPL